MKRIFRNWFAGFAAICVTNFLYISLSKPGSGVMVYALESSKILLVLCALSFCGYLIFSKKEEREIRLPEDKTAEKEGTQQ